ncbi:MAG: hypothetical protein KDA42_12145 [Planctomycetales bacterium]|nr:hypothetical protein [Planctomycetales bacterium]
MDHLAGSNIEHIDFLPVRFREQSERRTVNVWRLVAAGGFAVMVLAGAWMQQQTLRALESQLAQVTLNHNVALARTQRLADTKARLALADARAELAAYLQHPWPRSQVLAAIINPLPESVVLKQVRFTKRLSDQQRDRAAATSKTREGPGATNESNLDPATEDLQMLRDSVGEIEIIQIVGSAGDVSDLYDYLASVSENPLVSSAKVESIEREERRVSPRRETGSQNSLGRGSDERRRGAESETAALDEATFSAVIVLRGAYGTVKGPQSPLRPEEKKRLPSASDGNLANQHERQPAA